MCGIAGHSFCSTKTISSENIDIAKGCISHRGPDDSGVFDCLTSGICLTHTRLSILDLSPLGHQPMQSQDGMAVVVFNGEVYNFRELRSGLENKGVQFRGNSDTEVLLNLYQCEGEDMLSRLNGIFAFAIWDQGKQKLFVARDAFGVKPLYYAELKDQFVFASEIKALMPLMPELGHLDMSALDRYLSYLWCPGEGSPLQDVRKLLPGHAMWVTAGRIERCWEWYRLPVARPKSPARRFNAAFVVKGTSDHLRTAVHRQLVSDVQVGAFLSGGLDSSSVVAFAR